MDEHERTVLIDMDGVMADFDTAAIASIDKKLVVPRSQFYIAQDYPEELRKEIEAAYNSPGFFEHLEPMPGLLEAWQTLIDNGYTPRVASAPLSSNPTAIEGKIKWLDKIMVPEFGPKVVEEAIIDKNKWKHPGLVLIDDRPDVPRGPDSQHIAQWEHILFGWEHLSSVPLAATAFRLLHWSDINSLLDTLAIVKK